MVPLHSASTSAQTTLETYCHRLAPLETDSKICVQEFYLDMFEIRNYEVKKQNQAEGEFEE